MNNTTREYTFISLNSSYITTLAALIGFRAMSLGQLTLLADLGNMMSYGVLFCFIAAITVIPSMLVINERVKIKNDL